jgi:hypothetical protein
LAHDLPPWYIVYQQTQRWLEAGCPGKVLLFANNALYSSQSAESYLQRETVIRPVSDPAREETAIFEILANL